MPAEGGGGGGGGACSLCLARERRTRLVADEPRAAATLRQLAGTQWPHDPHMRMCWECNAIITKISRFKSQVLLAQTLLEAQKCEGRVQCLSQLIKIDKSTYDKQYIYNTDLFGDGNASVEPVEVKVESDKFHRDLILFEEWNERDYDDYESKDTEDIKQLMEGSEAIANNEEDNKGDIKLLSDDIPLKILAKHSKHDKKVKKKDKSKKGKKSKRKIAEVAKEAVKEILKKPKSTERIKDNVRKTEKIKKEEGNLKEIKEKLKSKSKEKFSQKGAFKANKQDFTDICEKVRATGVELLVARDNYRKSMGFQQTPHHCWSCILEFANDEDLAQHSVEKHAEALGALVCEICQCRFGTPSELDVHTLTHDHTVYRCKLCEYLSPSPEHMLRHHRSHDGMKYLKVDIEGQASGVADAGREPRKRGRRGRGGRMSQREPKGILKECDVCGAKLRTPYFYLHYDVHVSKERFECDHCGRVFNTRRKIFEHMRLHKEPKCMCQVCGKMCHTVPKLQIHMLSHLGEQDRPFQCAYCPKKFTGKDKLDRHTKIHEGMKEFECTFCQASFRVNSELTYHMKLKHSYGVIKKKQYDPTKPVFSYNKARHPKVKTEGKEKTSLTLPRKPKEKRIKEPKLDTVKDKDEPVQCVICQKMFNQRVHLNAHMVVHTGDRPYGCNECDKTFKFRTGLWSHKLLHKGLKTNVCTVCGAKFTLAGNLRAHMKIHTGEKPFMCDVCGQKFIYRRNLKNHYKVHMKYTQ